MYACDLEKQKISQGDIFQNFSFLRWIEKEGDSIKGDEITVPFFVVLTQECDLEQDFEEREKGSTEKSDKIIQSVLVCPAYLAEQVRTGKYLSHLKITGNLYGSDQWNIIKSNNHKRFHFLKGKEEMGMPDIVIDFKQYYALPVHILYKLYKNHYLCSMQDLFKENLSHRFAFYLSRIGLPDFSKIDGKSKIDD